MVKPRADREPTAPHRRTPAPEGVSLGDLLQVLRRRKLYLIVPVVLSLLYFGHVAWTAEPWYEASTVLLGEQLDDYEALEPGAPVWIEDHIGAIRELVHRPSFLAELAERFDLYEPEGGRIPGWAIAHLSSSVWVRQEGEDTFSMGYSGEDPEEVAAVTAGMAELFVERMTAARDTRASAVNMVVEGELAELKQKLDEHEARIEEYKQRSGQSLPENLPILVGEASALRSEAQDQAAAIAGLEADRQQVQGELDAMEAQGVVGRDPEIEAMRTRLAELRKRYTAEHPEVVRAVQELAALEETRTGPATTARDVEMREIELRARARALDGRIAAARDHLQQIRSSMSSYESQIAAMPQRERQMSELMRDYEVTQEAYDELLGRRHYTQVTQRLSRSSRGLSFVVVDPPRVPTAPAGPERWRPILMGLVIGLTMAVLLTLFVEQVDTTMDDVDEVEQVMSMPVLAAIPAIPVKGHPRAVGRSGKVRLPTLYDPFGAASEQYRILAMSTRRMLDAAGARTLMVTSGSGGEGKTTTAVNLANALAEQVPGRVLLVDCDLRRPRIHEYLGGHLAEESPATVRGLRHLLENPDADVEPYLRRIGKLHVVADDTPSTDSYETLPARAEKVLTKLAERFHYVVLDAPPVVPMVDGHLLAEVVDRVLFVVRARHTPREVVERAMELFDFSTTLGVVVNDVDFRGKKYASAYHYYEKQYAAVSRQRATS